MVYVYVIQYVCEYVYVIRGKKQSNKVILYVYVYQKQRINKGVRTRYSKKKRSSKGILYAYLISQNKRSNRGICLRHSKKRITESILKVCVIPKRKDQQMHTTRIRQNK